MYYLIYMSIYIYIYIYIQAHKALTIWRLPQVLVIHLKRFRQDSNNDRFKITDPVNFPLKGLDLNEFVKGGSELPSGEKAGACVYDLFAISNHSGSLDRGVYNELTYIYIG